jgi:hypothetical protein
MEYLGVFQGLFGHLVLISFRSYGGIPTHQDVHQGVGVAQNNASRQQPVLYAKIRHASHSIRNVYYCSDRALF